jgi:hypothetical protein
MATANLAESVGRQVWLRSPLWDTVCLAFCWLPFYLWVVFGLKLGAEAWGLAALDDAANRQALVLATTAALGITYIHRHYTLLLVYGDSATFKARAKQYLLAPVVLLAVIVSARFGKGVTLIKLGPLEVTSWGMIVAVGTTWNIWHTLQQRYGILRAYGGRAQHGLETRAHARRDFWLLWSWVAVVVVLVLGYQRRTFSQHKSTWYIEQQLGPYFATPVATALSAAVVLATLVLTLNWLRHELNAAVPLKQRSARVVFLFSTILLLSVFAWHGPIVGYLCFGVAHALEYLAFVHHFTQRKYVGGADNSVPMGSGVPAGVAATLFSQPALSVPLLIGGLIAAYLLLRSYRGTDAYVVYYITTSFLHFLYDGWIWKVRTQPIAKPLGISA